MNSAEERDETAAFRAANARLLVAQSRSRMDACKLLKRQAEQHCRLSRELLSSWRSRR